MKEIYNIQNRWIKAVILIFLLYPVFMIHLWRKGKAGRISAVIISILMIIWLWPASESKIQYTKKNEYEIVDLSDAYDSGRCRKRTNYIVIHHTAMPSAQKTSILQIVSIHMKQHGWSSIAYQYLIMNGKIYKLHNDDDIAPHTADYNSSTIGICIHGNYSQEVLSESDKSKLIWLIRILQDKYKLDKSKVVKHGDLNATECCGNNINLNEIRKCLKSY